MDKKKNAPRKNGATGNLARQLEMMFRGEITFTSFAIATRKEFERMAAYLARRWEPPSSMSIEDLVQELYLGAWMWTWKWREGGASLARFVVFNAMTYAKNALHKARGAKLSGVRDKNPSRIERPLSSLGPATHDGVAFGETIAETILAVDAVAEVAIAEEQERALRVETVLAACETPLERRAVLALADARGEADVAGVVLYDDIDLRIGLRMSNEARGRNIAITKAMGVLARVDPEGALAS